MAPRAKGRMRKDRRHAPVRRDHGSGVARRLPRKPRLQPGRCPEGGLTAAEACAARPSCGRADIDIHGCAFTEGAVQLIDDGELEWMAELNWRQHGLLGQGYASEHKFIAEAIRLFAEQTVEPWPDGVDHFLARA